MPILRNIIRSKRNEDSTESNDDSTTSYDNFEIIEIQHNDSKDNSIKKKIPNSELASLTHAYSRSRVEPEHDEDAEEADYEDKQVKRELKQRHIGMIALGGTIGTGLFVGIATPLADAGPVGALIAYIFMGSIVYFVTQALGEMATFIPVTSSITVFSQRFLSPAFGVANGYMYWFNWAITFAVEISVVGQVIQYWTDAVPLAAWIAIFWVLVTLMNFFPVKVYGEVEFWVAFMKVIAIVGYLLYALIIVCGGSKKQGPIGFRYWRNPGAWGNGLTSDGEPIYSSKYEGRFLGWVASLINAAFTYQGTELVGITAGEAANPRKTVPRAINKVVFRIVLFYIMSLFFIGLLVPFTDSRLSDDTTVIASSPFVISIENAGTKILPDIFNAIVMVTVLSAANSNVYVGSRVLYSLAHTKVAPKIFARVTRQGVPFMGVICTSLLGLLAFLVVDNNANTAFNWLVDISTLAGLCAWLFISLAHVRFMQVLKQRGISRDDLPFKAKFMPWGSYYAAFWVFVIIFVQGFQAFSPHFDVTTFFTDYISLILLAVVFIGAQLYYRCRFLWKLEDVDIDSDRREIEDAIWEDDEPKTIWDKFWAAIA
ncbi:hypothetical protein KAFR_0D03940 [Kazachstania africana CBS 2517]|uniref:Amino acid permease/ SLC12A domain-containing protein n=1 Tax=Kazachstania africana (strain ATCC 22294 / BCRC 22015 / CBS 2517 / CECT 1963 / NBRC 1671 / NRRL Y-8276) TaxID=1071382 RepID=H2AUJ2_KAZAF|nr:hypothetical protein KAFR_0D03940 [Kazachstania africana CBS 2517]CCF58042.1 hypothetical protein KAFR_0D03940 [Kazachstania africana CBS 2517]